MISLAPYQHLTPETIHLFQYKSLHFAYVIHGSYSRQLQPDTAHVLRALLSARGGSARVAVDSHSRRQLKEAHRRLSVLDRDAARAVADAKREMAQRDSMLAATQTPVGLRAFMGQVSRDHYVYVTRRCNMACDYCWNIGGTLGERRAPEPTKELMERIVDRIVEFSDPDRLQRVLFFGGEPLLAAPLMDHFARYARRRGKAKGIRFWYLLDTNGTVWNPAIAEMARRHDFYFIVSIDGQASTHDPHRPFKNGRPSHSTIIRNIEKMVTDLPGKIGARAVLGDTSYSLRDTYHFFRPYGLAELQVFYHSFSGFCGSEDKSLQPKSSIKSYRKELRSEVDALEGILDQGMVPQMDMEHLRLMKFRMEGRRILARCLPGVTQMIFQSDGFIYPCLYLNQQSYRMGTVREGLASLAYCMKACRRHVGNERTCSTCWARFACGGCCQARCLAANDDAERPILLECARTKEDLKVHCYLLAKYCGERGIPFDDLMRAGSGSIPVETIG